MKKYNDTDLRKAINRAEQKRKPATVPDDFLENVLNEIESETKPKTVKLRRWVAAAACLVILVGVGAIITHNQNPTPQPTVAIIADTSVTMPTEPTQPQVAETEIAPEPAPIPEPKPEPSKPKRKNNKTEQKPAPDNQLDEIIIQMADNQKATKRVLDCGHEQDSTTTEMVYLFPKNSGDIMARLLMSAANYDENTDGYFLNYSQQQFFFTLNDGHTGKNYLWIAEKTDDGRIMLYSFHSPIGSELGSECYHDYHNKLLYSNMNTITNI